MQRDLDKNSSNISDVYYNMSLLPSKIDVSTSITTNNSNYTTILLTATIIANKIIASNLLLLANAKTYTTLQSFTAGIETKSISITSSNNNDLTLGYSSTNSGSQSTVLGVNAICNSYNSVALGYHAQANASFCTTIGAMSSYSNIAIGNTCIGFNAGINLNNILDTYHTCIGYNATINGIQQRNCIEFNINWL